MKKILLLLSISIGIITTGCSDFIVKENDSNKNVLDFERAWQITKQVYPYFEFKQIDWDSIYTIYYPRAERTNGDEIYQVLYNMMAELKDGHVNITTPGGQFIRTYIPPRRQKDRYAFDPLVVRKYFDEELRLAGDRKLEYGILTDNIGYMRITTFLRGDWIDEFSVVMNYLENTNGIILDVRHNNGGSDLMVLEIVGRFIDTPLDLPIHYENGLAIQHPPLEPQGSFQYLNSIVVLINGVCFSSCEHFVEMMKQIPSVIAIGDTTAGGSGAPQTFQLPSGIEIDVCTKDIRRYDGLPYEWLGIPPDIYVPQTEEDIAQGRDKQLEYAIQFLYQEDDVRKNFRKK